MGGFEQILTSDFYKWKEWKICKIFHQYIKIVSQSELIVEHDYFSYIFNSNTMPKLAKIQNV